MIRVLFVCHGNICRSPMAEFLFKDMVNKKGKNKDFYIASAATSFEEIGNPVHYGTKDILNSLGIDCSQKRAIRMTKDDYSKYDYILAMDSNNIRNILNIIGKDVLNKVYLLLDFVGLHQNIKDPWYTRNFKETYEDISKGLNGFYNYLIQENKLY